MNVSALLAGFTPIDFNSACDLASSDTENCLADNGLGVTPGAINNYCCTLVGTTVDNCLGVNRVSQMPVTATLELKYFADLATQSNGLNPVPTLGGSCVSLGE